MPPPEAGVKGDKGSEHKGVHTGLPFSPGCWAPGLPSTLHWACSKGQVFLGAHWIQRGCDLVCLLPFRPQTILWLVAR